MSQAPATASNAIRQVPYEYYTPRLLPPVVFSDDEREPGEKETSQVDSSDTKQEIKEEKASEEDNSGLEERIKAQKRAYEQRKQETQNMRLKPKKKDPSNGELTPIFRLVHAIVRREHDIFDDLINRIDINEKGQMGWSRTCFLFFAISLHFEAKRVKQK
ncbi:hypothetical protein RFI_16136 [Reticulomyxa filosa]|uniref:Uncharacterized protein n=1 Tax=Reticulomyxa filosa TaxID=46433 RepID=X6N5P4_RETFI|nr:hypothetical protein RFI_16136 [Reticulomyxa filosa]|eukprot:ETO21069.1 hypothetical protein RFI_16136 [Reticulomyxa filosa]